MSQTRKQPSTLYALYLIVLLATAYFVFGLLGLFLAVPPSNAGAVWPPAGIALSALLLFGNRIWPGIFFGNFAICAWAFGYDSGAIIIYLLTGIGATSCALTGSFLIRRFVGFPNPLTADRAIIYFLLLGGPISCLIPATVGLTSMALSGIVATSEIPINWFCWWAGDTIGVLVFSPLMLILFSQSGELWRQRRISVGLPLIISFVLVVLFFLYASKLESNQEKTQFNTIAITLTKTLNDRIENLLHNLNSVSNLFRNTKQTNEQQFKLYASQAFAQFEELKSLDWHALQDVTVENQAKIKLLYSAQRPDLETINTQDTKQNNSTSTRSPKIASKQFIGSIYKPSSKYLDEYIQYNFPVYPQAISDEIQQNPRGVISIVISIPELIDTAFKGLMFNNILLNINSLNKPESISAIYSEFSTKNQPANPTLYLQQKISFGHEQWLLGFHSNPLFVNPLHHWTIWWVLISGLLFTSLLGVSLLILTGRYFRTEAIVEMRTAALIKENNSRKKVEQQLKLSKDKAESASQAKSHFLSNISHELRTPLNGILGFTQLLLKKPSRSNEDKEKINIINNCGEYLLTLINDILDISKIESQKMEIEPSPFDLKCFLFDIFAVFKLKAAEKNIRFNIYQDPLPDTVIGDEKRLRQIFINLLSNAIKFTERGSVSVTISYKQDEINLQVQDTGCGISEDDYETIFNPFIQINHPLHSQQGTGLGLSITKNLIELMHGSISVKSHLNQGSLFSISIPLSESAELLPVAVNPAKQIIGYKGPIRSILIVDDDEDNALLLQTILQDLKFSVSRVNSGEECLEFCDTTIPDLIFMDMMMPGMDGMQTTRRLQELYPATKQHIIGMSASVFSQEKQKFLDSGCQFFIAKPIKFETLFTCIEKFFALQWNYLNPESTHNNQPLKVLIADDNEINRLLLSNMLTNLRCTVEMAENGEIAYQLLLTQSYQMAFIDINMPILNGFEVIKQLRKQTGPNQNIVCTAISAYVQQDKKNMALAAGFTNYITKPIDENVLQRLIQSYFVPARKHENFNF